MIKPSIILLGIFAASISSSNASMSALDNVSAKSSCNLLNQFLPFDYASRFSVKVSSDTNLPGSGVIFSKKKSTKENYYYYQVLTNHHVIDKGKDVKYNIETYNKKVYPVKSIQDLYPKSGDDLAILTFEANDCYSSCEVARLAKVNQHDYPTTIFSVGFPIPEGSKLPGLKINQSELNYVLPVPMKDGYQIGYTNYVESGMSGGAIFDCKGNVVGVNARSIAITRDSFILKNGKEIKPSDGERYEAVYKLNWGIPIPKFLIDAQATDLPVEVPKQPKIRTDDLHLQSAVRKK